jgi:ribosomal protein S18 acetylase RimI-like enzyme
MDVRELDRTELDEFVEELFLPFATELNDNDPSLALVSQERTRRTREYWRGWFDDDSKHLLVAVVDGRLVAYVAIEVKGVPPMFETGPELHVSEFYVREAYRRQGAGTALMRAAERTAEEHRCETLSLFVHVDNESARSFYETLGFTEDRLKLVKDV